MGEFGFIGWRAGRSRDRVMLVLRECIWNVLAVMRGFPTFDVTISLGYPSRFMAYRPSVSSLVTASRFLAGNGEAELKHISLFTSTFPCFSLSSSP